MLQSCLFVGTWGLLTLALGCSPKDGGEDDEQVDASCEGAAAHFWEICAEDLGNDFAELNAEMFRVDCVGMQGFMAREARCAARAASCQSLIEDCGITSVTFVCDVDTDCGNELSCSLDLEDCVACLDDADCNDGKACASGLCLSAENAFHQLETL